MDVFAPIYADMGLDVLALRSRNRAWQHERSHAFSGVVRGHIIKCTSDCLVICGGRLVMLRDGAVVSDFTGCGYLVALLLLERQKNRTPLCW